MHPSSLSQLWHEAVTAEPLPPRLLVLGTAVAALILVGWRRAWPLSRTVVTIAHEGGHALVALAAGRRLDGVRVHRSTAGLTVSAGNASGPGIVATAAAGYLSPPLLGLGAAALLATGHLVAALLLSLVLLAALTLMVRNAYGILATVTVAVAVGLVIWRGSSLLQAAFGYAMAWFLLLGGIRPVLELQRSRAARGRASPVGRGPARGAHGTFPAGHRVALFALVALGALAASGFWRPAYRRSGASARKLAYVAMFSRVGQRVSSYQAGPRPHDVLERAAVGPLRSAPAAGPPGSPARSGRSQEKRSSGKPSSCAGQVLVGHG